MFSIAVKQRDAANHRNSQRADNCRGSLSQLRRAGDRRQFTPRARAVPLENFGVTKGRVLDGCSFRGAFDEQTRRPAPDFSGRSYCRRARHHLRRSLLLPAERDEPGRHTPIGRERIARRGLLQTRARVGRAPFRRIVIESVGESMHHNC